MPGMLPSDVAEMSILDFDKCAMPFIQTHWSDRQRGYIVTILSATHHATLQYTFDDEEIREAGEIYDSHDKYTALCPTPPPPPRRKPPSQFIHRRQAAPFPTMHAVSTLLEANCPARLTADQSYAGWQHRALCGGFAMVLPAALLGDRRPIIRPVFGKAAAVIRARATKDGLAPSEVRTFVQEVEQKTFAPRIVARYALTLA